MDQVAAFMIGVGILISILGILAFFIPALTKIINFPGNERIKALAALIAGIIISVIGYLYR
jgi:sorbitol-specific phosphotransferase system component IIC